MCRCTRDFDGDGRTCVGNVSYHFLEKKSRNKRYVVTSTWLLSIHILGKDYRD